MLGLTRDDLSVDFYFDLPAFLLVVGHVPPRKTGLALSVLKKDETNLHANRIKGYGNDEFYVRLQLLEKRYKSLWEKQFASE